MCISSAYFFVMINGSPKFLFISTRGLQHGNLLFPLLFVIEVEAPRRLISTSIFIGWPHKCIIQSCILMWFFNQSQTSSFQWYMSF